MAELQRVERELQEKAHAQMMLNNDEHTGQIRATEMLDDMVHMGMNNVLAAAASAMAASPPVSAPCVTTSPALPSGSGSTTTNAPTNVRNVTNLANLPPSERPKAKPSRKIVNNQQNMAASAAQQAAAGAGDKSKKCQLQVCVKISFSRV